MTPSDIRKDRNLEMEVRGLEVILQSWMDRCEEVERKNAQLEAQVEAAFLEGYSAANGEWHSKEAWHGSKARAALNSEGKE